MKSLNLITLILGLALISCSKQQSENEAGAGTEYTENEANVITTEFWVRGNCGMCERRIENALTSLEGVEMASWDMDSKTATVIYDSELQDEEAFHKAVANVGHKTELKEANPEAYNELPACCLDPDDENFQDM